MRDDDRIGKLTWLGQVFVIAAVLAFFTTTQYVRARGLSYLGPDGPQLARHQAVMEERAGSPWQYRLLAEYVTEATIQALDRLQVPQHYAVSFIGLRIVADITILLLTYLYCRKLGLLPMHGLVAMAVLAWAMSYSHYDSDLSLNTFLDVIFYLLAAIFIIQGKYRWIIPLTLLAALNRETSGLIPLMLLLAARFVMPRYQLRKIAPFTFVSGAIFFVVFVTLRGQFGEQQLFAPYGHLPGLDLFQYNFGRSQTWVQLIATFSIIPIIAIAGYRKWPGYLQGFMWAIVPIWFVVHAFAAVMAETRLFLVPLAVVFIPGALWTLARESSDATLHGRGIRIVRKRRTSFRSHIEEEEE